MLSAPSTPKGRAWHLDRHDGLVDPPFKSWPWRRKQLREQFAQYDDFRLMINEFLAWPVTYECLAAPVTPKIWVMYAQMPSSYKEMAEDTVGNHIPSMMEGKATSGTIIRLLWLFNIWESRTGLQVKNLKVILEYGAGFGLSSLVLERLGFTGEHYIVDYPELNYLAQCYHYVAGVRKLKINYLDDAPGRWTIKPDLFMGVNYYDEVPFRLRRSLWSRGKKSHHLIMYRPVSKVYYQSRKDLVEVDNEAWFSAKTNNQNWYQASRPDGRWLLIN